MRSPSSKNAPASCGRRRPLPPSPRVQLPPSTSTEDASRALKRLPPHKRVPRRAELVVALVMIQVLLEAVFIHNAHACDLVLVVLVYK